MDFVANIATVLHDHWYSVTAGPFELTAHVGPLLAAILINPGSRNAHCPRRGMGKSLWSREGGAEQNMPCGAQESRSYWTTGPPVAPITKEYRFWLAKSATLDSPFARSRLIYSLSSVTWAAWTPCRSFESLPVTLYGSGVANVRRDKDSKPETYGEGIKKEIQYRRTYRHFSELLATPRASVKIPKFDAARRISKQREAIEFAEEDCGNWQIFRWTVCRLGYSEGAAMAVGSLSLHIGIWRTTACVPNR